MSLKAKIEAVIYASEEPVTLAQLTGLLGEEGQAELDALAAQQQSLALEDESAIDSANPEPVEDADALNEEVLEPEVVLQEQQSPVTLTEDSPSQPESKDPGTANTTETSSGEETSTSDAKSIAAATKFREAEQKLAARKLRDYFRLILDQLIADYATSDRGLEIREVAGGFRLATKPEYHDAVRGFVKSLKPPLKLTLQALETLAVVAYKQPVTAPEVSEIRGVDSAGVLGSLLTRKLVTTAGRKQVIGRPILYKTTKDFLLRFGLKDINELPSIEEFEKMAGELNETLLDQPLETEAQEETPMEASEQQPGQPQGESSPSDGGSPPIRERDAPPEPTYIHHETPEDLMSDDSTHLEGRDREPADPSEVERSTNSKT
jgi:segregation and condensation protein B